jgi:hypothetical protein
MFLTDPTHKPKKPEKCLGSKRGGSKIMDENTEYLFWQMLRVIESDTNPEKNILNKCLVEGAYKHWNETHPDAPPMKPNWIK